MHINLDDLTEIKKIDKENVLGSIDALPDQCLHAWEDASKVKVPDNYKNIEHIVMCGMGGSGLGARVIESVFTEDLRFPFVRVHDYHLPGFANHKSLVMCSSYSGNTEEIVNTLNQALKRKSKTVVIGTGGKLLEEAKKSGSPFYKIDPKYNPSKQPRMAIGYSIVGQLVLASRAKLFNLTKDDVYDFCNVMKKVQEKCSQSVPESKNPSKKLAKKMYGKNIFYISSHHLTGATHTVSNQLNENAKVFSSEFVIPELNHHLMEGLKYPETNKERLFFILFDSNLYPERIQKRMYVTKDVIEKNNIEVHSYKATSKTKLSQAFEVIQFGAYVNLYLASLYGQNPAPIPWVDYFKEKLANF